MKLVAIYKLGFCHHIDQSSVLKVMIVVTASTIAANTKLDKQYHSHRQLSGHF